MKVIRRTLIILIFISLVISVYVTQIYHFKPYSEIKKQYADFGLSETHFEVTDHNSFVVFDNAPKSNAWSYLKNSFWGFKEIYSGSIGDQSPFFEQIGFTFTYAFDEIEKDQNYYYGFIDDPRIEVVRIYNTKNELLGTATIYKDKSTPFWFFPMGDVKEESVIIKTLDASRHDISSVEITEKGFNINYYNLE